jgi:hypothetical protein
MSPGKHESELKCGASIGWDSIQGNNVQVVEFPDVHIKLLVTITVCKRRWKPITGQRPGELGGNQDTLDGEGTAHGAFITMISRSSPDVEDVLLM